MFRTGSKTKLLQVLIVIINFYWVIGSIEGAVANQNPPQTHENSKVNNAYQEYHMEHRVTKQEAIMALEPVNDTFFDAPLPPGCKAIVCTDSLMKYCLGPQFLNDHCWCEQAHTKEGLPWVPHTCYVGDKDSSAFIGSCFAYNGVKECCCDRALAKRWKFLSTSNRIEGSHSIILMSLGILMTIRTHLFTRD